MEYIFAELTFADARNFSIFEIPNLVPGYIKTFHLKEYTCGIKDEIFIYMQREKLWE